MLRTLNLDELPQLWHVVRGDMSLVGPRPLLVEYLDRYSPRQSRRHEVLPGITGWAQVNGCNTLTWEQKFEYDVWYVDNVSLAVDIRILLQTLASVARRCGITPDDSASVPGLSRKQGMTATDSTRVGVHTFGQVVRRHIRPPEAPFPPPPCRR